MIKEHEGNSIPLLMVKQLLLEKFDKKEAFLLMNYIKGCDVNQNGFLSIKEWENFQGNLGLKVAKPKLVFEKLSFKDDVDWYSQLQSVKKRTQMDFTLEFLSQISEHEGQIVSMVTIK